MMTESQVIDEDLDSIEITTRILDIQECCELHTWLVDLPGNVWSYNDASHALTHLLETRKAFVTLPRSQAKEAIYCKVKWG